MRRLPWRYRKRLLKHAPLKKKNNFRKVADATDFSEII